MEHELKSANEVNRQVIFHPEKITKFDEPQLKIMGMLHGTLELEELFVLFNAVISDSVSHQHLGYSYQDENIDINIGSPDGHTVAFSLMLAEQELGELKVSSNSMMSDANMELLEHLIAALVLPLRNALLYKQALDKASVDQLTGVANRGAFNTAAEQECDLAQRHENALSLMMLDIDHFKQINDNYGHIVGDHALKSFVDCIGECVRKSDTMYRYGGEEFAIILRSTELEGATLLAERMRKKIEEMQFTYQDVILFITVSIGVTQYRKDESEHSLIERADKLLYEAKTSGRNCTKAG